MYTKLWFDIYLRVITPWLRGTMICLRCVNRFRFDYNCRLPASSFRGAGVCLYYRFFQWFLSVPLVGCVWMFHLLCQPDSVQWIIYCVDDLVCCRLTCINVTCFWQQNSLRLQLSVCVSSITVTHEMGLLNTFWHFVDILQMPSQKWSCYRASSWPS